MKVRRIDFYPDDWLAGTMELESDERGVYITACALMYSRGGDIGIDLLRAACRGHGHAFKRILGRLEALGKLTLNEGQISSKRCANELQRRAKSIAKASQNGVKGNNIRWLDIATRSDTAIAFNLQSSINSKKEETPNGVSKKERGCRIDRWTAPDNWLEEGAAARLKANLPAIDLHLESQKFQDYWRAKSGKDGIKLDWLATWRNWCRNARGVPIVSNQDDEELSPEMKEAISKVPPGSSVDDKMWCIRLQRYIKDGSWLPTYYGPPPNEPFSRVPHAILTAFGLAAKESLQ